MLKLTMQQIRYFLDLCDTLNFTETAKRQYLSQPALSRQINVLEEKVGVQLFKRNHRNVELTPEGVLVQEEFQSFVLTYNRMLEDLLQIANHKRGLLKMSVSNYINPAVITERIIRPFRQNAPFIELVCESDNFLTMKRKMKEKESDIFFLPDFEIESFPNYEKEKIIDLEVGAIVSPAGISGCGERVNPAELSGQPLILIDSAESPGFSRRAVALCKKTGITPSRMIAVPDICSLIFSILSGQGFAIADAIVPDASGLLKFLHLGGECQETIYAMWRKDNSNGALKRMVMEANGNWDLRRETAPGDREEGNSGELNK